MMLLGVLAVCLVMSSTVSVSHYEPFFGDLQTSEKTKNELSHVEIQLKRELYTLSLRLINTKISLIQLKVILREQGEMLTQFEQQRTILERQRGECHKAIERLRAQKARVLLALEQRAWRPLAVLTMDGLGTQQSKNPIITLVLREILRRIKFLERASQSEMTAIEAKRNAVSLKHHGLSLVQRAISHEHNSLHALLRRQTALLRFTEARCRAAARRILAIRETGSLRDLLTQQSNRPTANHMKEQAVSIPSIPIPLETHRRQSGALPAERHACQAREERHRLAERQDTRTARTDSSKSVKHQSDLTHEKIASASYRPFSKARGHLPMPTRGRVTTFYGQINDVGLASRGIVISARSGAQVVASYHGVVVFSGLLRGYGRLLIIEHGEGYHMVLAGMARIDAEMGQRLLVGEPVGVIENIIKPVLYVELRREGHPINPMPWLVACEGGAKG